MTCHSVHTWKEHDLGLLLHADDTEGRAVNGPRIVSFLGFVGSRGWGALRAWQAVIRLGFSRSWLMDAEAV